MRLSTIPDQVLDDYDLDRADARQEARSGQLWATPDGRAVAVAPTGAAALWMLGVEKVSRVQCSTMSEANIVKVHRARSLVALRRPRVRSFDVEVRLGDGVVTVGRMAASMQYVRPAQPQPITIDALYEAMERYQAETLEAPTLLFANRHELREAARQDCDPMWAAAFESGTLLGMRLDLSAPPGVWSVGGTAAAPLGRGQSGPRSTQVPSELLQALEDSELRERLLPRPSSSAQRQQ